jgi:hypothetical protein
MWQWRADRWEFREKRALQAGALHAGEEDTKIRERAVQQFLVRYSVDALVIRDFDQRGVNLSEIAHALGISVHI